MILNYENVLKEIIGQSGIEFEEIEKLLPEIEKAKERISEKLKTEYDALQLPYVMSLKTTEIVETAKEIRENYENFVVVGMGGSSLGNQMLHYAFNGIYHNMQSHPKMYFLDNVDPKSTETLLNSLDLSKTMFNVITKSGSTAETIQNFLLITDFLKEHFLDPKKHLIFTTDPEKGLLKKLSKEMGIKTFDIPPYVGGRYSVLSAVGLLSAAVENIDISVLLRGAELTRLRVLNSDPINCMAMVLPAIQYLLFKNKGVNINAMFTYSDGLSYLGQWYRQLLSESIGKKYDRNGKEIYTGITPLAVRGTSDQHSILQLFLEGPFDKLIIMVAPKDYKSELSVKGEFVNEESVEYLKGKKYSDLIKAEFDGTKAALKKNGRPFVSIELSEIREEEIGKLIYMLEYSVIMLGELLGVNPVDQPAVELGKQFTYGIMGRKGFESKEEEFERLISPESKYTIENDAL